MRKTVVEYKAGPYLPLTENWIYNHLVKLDRYNPLVYCHTRKNAGNFPDVPVRSLHLKSQRYPWTYFNNRFYEAYGFYPLYRFFLGRDRPHLVHAHFGPSGYRFLKLKKKFGLPMVTTFYGHDVSGLPRRYPAIRKGYLELFRYGELFLVEGEHMRGSLAGLGCPREKIIVHHLGIDLQKLPYRPREPGEGGEIKILVSARFREKKGIPYGVEALGVAKHDNPGLKIRMSIIGDSLGYPEEEDEKSRIMRKIAEYGLKEDVRLLGYQPYEVFIEELYRHQILLAPSVVAEDGETEGGAPVSIIEAIASGMPVLATRHCDIPEIIRDGENGFLTSERDVAALAERMAWLAAHPESWAGMAARGRRHAEEGYDLGMQVRRLEDIYDGMLSL